MTEINEASRAIIKLMCLKQENEKLLYNVVNAYTPPKVDSSESRLKNILNQALYYLNIVWNAFKSIFGLSDYQKGIKLIKNYGENDRSAFINAIAESPGISSDVIQRIESLIQLMIKQLFNGNLAHVWLDTAMKHNKHPEGCANPDLQPDLIKFSPKHLVSTLTIHKANQTSIPKSRWYDLSFPVSQLPQINF